MDVFGSVAAWFVHSSMTKTRWSCPLYRIAAWRAHGSVTRIQQFFQCHFRSPLGLSVPSQHDKDTVVLFRACCEHLGPHATESRCFRGSPCYEKDRTRMMWFDTSFLVCEFERKSRQTDRRIDRQTDRQTDRDKER